MLSVPWALRIWQLMSLPSGKLLMISFHGRRKDQFLFIRMKRSHPSVDVRSFSREVMNLKWSSLPVASDRNGTWISYSHRRCVVSLALFSTCSLVDIELALHYILLTFPFYGLIGVLPTISGHSLPFVRQV